MTQGSLWIEPLKKLLPPPKDARHCDGIGIDSHGQRYAVKFTTRYAALPATEAFCHQLAEYCGIAVPQWKPVENARDGRIGFGSVWVPDVMNIGGQRWTLYWTGIEPGTQARFFSQCAVLDGFLANNDRHLGNFLLSGEQRVLARPLAGDYSCAWWMRRWQDDEYLRDNCHSVRIYRALRRKQAWCQATARSALERIDSLQPETILSWAKTWPPSWIQAGQVEDLLIWWDSHSRSHRLQRMHEQIHRGHLPL